MRKVIPALSVLAALVGVSAFALWMTLDPGLPAPSGDDWKRAKARIEQDFQAGDGIVVHPFWLTDAAGVLAQLDRKQKRWELVDQSIPPDPIFAARKKRVWVLSAMGRTDAGEPAGGQMTLEEDLGGGLALKRYDMPASPIEVDLLDRIAKAKVERHADGKSRTCRWVGRRHNCRGKPWENVGVETKHAGGATRRCAVLHPYPNGGVVDLTWAKVKLSEGLLVRSGFTLDAARNEKGSDVVFTVRLDGKQVYERTEPKNGWTWTSGWIDTGGRRGSTATVTLSVTAAEEAFRDLCVDAFVMSRPL